MGFVEDVILEAQSAPEQPCQTTADLLLDSIISGDGKAIAQTDDELVQLTEVGATNSHDVNGSNPTDTKHSNGQDVLSQTQTSNNAATEIPTADSQRLPNPSTNLDTAGKAPMNERLDSTESTMDGAMRPSRNRAVKTNRPSDVIDAEYRPTTHEEKQNWRGFCEIESEPAILNALIRDLGVDDLGLKEVYAIDEEIIEQLGPRVHGLLFLYQVSDDDDDLDNDAVNEDDEEAKDAPIPASLWFANQTASNACATVALVNLLANTQSGHGPSTSRGSTEPHADNMTIINRLLCDTMDFADGSHRHRQLRANEDSPVDVVAFQRGEAVRKLCGSVHNKYARKMDMLNADLLIDNEWCDAEKKSKNSKKRQPAKSTKRKAKPNKRKKPNLEDSVHHYVAYLHKDGAIWMLDGMQYRPVRLKSYTADEKDWWRAVLPMIQQRMAQFEFGGIGANLLALVDRPADSSGSQYQADRDHAEAKQVDDGPLLHAWIEMVVASKAWKDDMIAKGSF